MPRGKAQRGKGFMDVIGKIGNFLKDTKLISTIGSMIPNPTAQRVAGIASQFGLGKRRKRRTTTATAATKRRTTATTTTGGRKRGRPRKGGRTVDAPQFFIKNDGSGINAGWVR